MNKEKYNLVMSTPDYIRVLIDFQQSIWRSKKEKTWLTPREKEFAVATIIGLWEGYTNPNTEGFTQIYEKFFKNKVTSSDIHIYLKKLSNKKFITYDKNDQRIVAGGFWEGVRNGTSWILELTIQD